MYTAVLASFLAVCPKSELSGKEFQLRNTS